VRAGLLPVPVVALLAVPLSACSGFLHSNAQPEQTYFLRAPLGSAPAAEGNATSSAPGTPVSLRVGHPLAAPGLDSPHIMLVQTDHRLDFYSGSRWPAPVPDVVESLAVQTLRASSQWASIEDSRSPFPSSYLLQVTVRRFEADYTGGGAAPEVHVVLDCILGRREGRDVVATFIAAGSATASTNRLSEVVAAFEQAAATALTALAQQSLAAVRADRTRAAQNPAAPKPSSSLQSQ
jgi:cholesterol transport system auxiliary component